jgi:hypothetical protein
MNAKLTLTIDESIIVKAKSYAKKTGKSLSEIIENYLESITVSSESQVNSEKLRKLMGSVKVPTDFNEEEELSDYFQKKHL